MSLKNKLQRFKNHLVPEQVQQPKNMNENPKNIDTKGEIPFIEMWEQANTKVYYLEDEYCFIREVHYPLSHQHGKYRFQDYIKAVDMWNHNGMKHPLSAYGYQPNDLFFFDTETTGLGGGVGNTIFLLGYAYLEKDEIILRQHFLPEPGLEIPLYYSFLENIDYTTLVTYNGKAFDWPQVKTRHTLIREHVPKLPSFGHFDLYHASRRFWKDQLESVKLVNVEKDILEFERKDDVPGFLAPMIYFDFVERKNPEGIITVLQHNENDILSLITLYTHLTFQILQLDPSQTSQEKLILGKWLQAIGEKDVAIQTFEKLSLANEIEAKFELAFHLKRQKKYSDARDLWLEVLEKGNGKLKIKSSIEVAKLFEHQFKNYDQALKIARIGLSLHEEERSGKSKKDDKIYQDLIKRMTRLERK
ncbi:ribonuclease H-like domain-containing protein [Heyndrickxia oleronia]|uniref:YprB ribonuclease H-like domain-containing protein n=1 Tax=Heyndrickxia oleronia TaxID=38875 RepID=A0A8E2LEZ3_9BACI|nr:ribonuclease H-like domain-containing protein [Heyndrickxia oleronia]MEC1374753.1 ribonuclease H-like domain-containing protein [Heyndrickxia oleronia]OOP68858.1 hypothetical protein BWZ43_08270 [Heyndrickxia oleronia]QQZ06811.1 ribonuclease H-like domain-containing protein [Heyndrickxia oleronia]